MAGMKGLYLGLGVAVVGAGAYFMTAGDGGTVPTGPIPTEEVDAGREFAGYVTGDDKAPVEIVEYADFQCSACQYYWLLTVRDVKERLVKAGKVRYVFRDFPLEMHDKSRVAHHAAACAAEQGRFEAMHDQLFAHQRDWSVMRGTGESAFRDYASQIGVDVDKYNECMSSGRYRGRIQASYEEGLSRGVGSTPTFFIGNSVYGGMSFDELRAIVDSLAAAATQ